MPLPIAPVVLTALTSVCAAESNRLPLRTAVIITSPEAKEQVPVDQEPELPLAKQGAEPLLGRWVRQVGAQDELGRDPSGHQHLGLASLLGVPALPTASEHRLGVQPGNGLLGRLEAGEGGRVAVCDQDAVGPA